MSIRRQLLISLLPPLILFMVLLSSFFYSKWSQEILEAFQSHLRSVVVTAAQPIEGETIQWLIQHREDPRKRDSPLFQNLLQIFSRIQRQIPANKIYLFSFESVESPLLQDKKKNTSPLKQRLLLMDTPSPTSKKRNLPATHPFGEEKIVYTKEPFVTDPYQAETSQKSMMSAFAPIFDREGDVVGLLGIDASLGFIEKQQEKALLIIVFGGGLTIFILIVAVVYVANQISRPVRKLNAAALTIAAGEYGERISVEGPKEVDELSNTLNTLSECLEETMSRLQESSLARERLYGEYECSLLLQHYMLQRALERLPKEYFSIEIVKSSTGVASRNLLFRAEQRSAEESSFICIEAKEPGFPALYSLLEEKTSNLSLPHVQVSFLFSQHTVSCSNEHFSPLLHWSMNQQNLFTFDGGTHSYEQGDMFFIVNTPLIQLFPHRQSMEKWIGKVLRHFASEGLSLVTTMLRNELHFLTKKNPSSEDLVILCFQTME